MFLANRICYFIDFIVDYLSGVPLELSVNMLINIISGRNLFPATGYLFLAWKTLSTLRKVHYEDMHIVFEHVKFLRATTLVNEVTEFVVSIQPNSGYFEVYL